MNVDAQYVLCHALRLQCVRPNLLEDFERSYGQKIAGQPSYLPLTVATGLRLAKRQTISTIVAHNCPMLIFTASMAPLQETPGVFGVFPTKIRSTTAYPVPHRNFNTSFWGRDIVWQQLGKGGKDRISCRTQDTGTGHRSKISLRKPRVLVVL